MLLARYYNVRQHRNGPRKVLHSETMRNHMQDVLPFIQLSFCRAS